MWTKTKPSSAGYYWKRFGKKDLEPEIVSLVIWPDDMVTFLSIGDEREYEVNDFTIDIIEWQPVLPPVD